MNKLPGVIPITDLRQDAAAVLRQVRSSKAPLNAPRKSDR